MSRQTSRSAQGGAAAQSPPQLGLHRDCWSSEAVAQSFGSGGYSRDSSTHDRSTMWIMNQNPAAYMTFLGLEEGNLPATGPHITTSWTAASIYDRDQYNSHCLGSGFGLSSSQAISALDLDDMLHFPITPAWNEWSVAGSPIGEEAVRVCPPAPQLTSASIIPGLTDFEPVMTANEAHGFAATQEQTDTPSQGSVAANTTCSHVSSVAPLSRKNSFQLEHHAQAPSNTTVQYQQLDFVVGPPSSSAWERSPVRRSDGGLLGNEESNLALPNTSQRQRNRVAANKCRKKSKAAIAQLETTERALAEQHASLLATASSLREQVVSLKNEILLHGKCDCDIIQHYLKNAARDLRESILSGQNPGQDGPVVSPALSPSVQDM